MSFRYYVQTNVMPPKISLTHPAGDSPKGPPPVQNACTSSIEAEPTPPYTPIPQASPPAASNSPSTPPAPPPFDSIKAEASPAYMPIASPASPPAMSPSPSTSFTPAAAPPPGARASPASPSLPSSPSSPAPAHSKLSAAQLLYASAAQKDTGFSDPLIRNPAILGGGGVAPTQRPTTLGGRALPAVPSNMNQAPILTTMNRNSVVAGVQSRSGSLLEGGAPQMVQNGAISVEYLTGPKAPYEHGQPQTPQMTAARLLAARAQTLPPNPTPPPKTDPSQAHTRRTSMYSTVSLAGSVANTQSSGGPSVPHIVTTLQQPSTQPMGSATSSFLTQVAAPKPIPAVSNPLPPPLPPKPAPPPASTLAQPNATGNMSIHSLMYRQLPGVGVGPQAALSPSPLQPNPGPQLDQPFTSRPPIPPPKHISQIIPASVPTFTPLQAKQLAQLTAQQNQSQAVQLSAQSTARAIKQASKALGKATKKAASATLNRLALGVEFVSALTTALVDPRTGQGVLEDSKLQAVLQGDVNADYQGVINALLQQQQKKPGQAAQYQVLIGQVQALQAHAMLKRIQLQQQGQASQLTLQAQTTGTSSLPAGANHQSNALPTQATGQAQAPQILSQPGLWNVPPPPPLASGQQALGSPPATQVAGVNGQALPLYSNTAPPDQSNAPSSPPPFNQLEQPLQSPSATPTSPPPAFAPQEGPQGQPSAPAPSDSDPAPSGDAFSGQSHQDLQQLVAQLLEQQQRQEQEKQQLLRQLQEQQALQQQQLLQQLQERQAAQQQHQEQLMAQLQASRALNAPAQQQIDFQNIAAQQMQAGSDLFNAQLQHQLAAQSQQTDTLAQSIAQQADATAQSITDAALQQGQDAANAILSGLLGGGVGQQQSAGLGNLVSSLLGGGQAGGNEEASSLSQLLGGGGEGEGVSSALSPLLGGGEDTSGLSSAFSQLLLGGGAGAAGEGQSSGLSQLLSGAGGGNATEAGVMDAYAALQANHLSNLFEMQGLRNAASLVSGDQYVTTTAYESVFSPMDTALANSLSYI
ncbi:hypothetical protein CC2G_010880 [Coprinopsis cinerea AmutBmut pab1-1]|nr:hypothetical protein CC2G_010880 [Coprinopsis cinerea AmutBmut pab1-1]